MIPVNTPSLTGNEKKYLAECIDTEWISSEGPFIKKFEDAFASYVGRQQGIAVANGSAALDVAVKAVGIGPGDEVIMPAFTIISPAASIVREGGIPVLVDSDPVTWNMDVNRIEEKITPKTKAILVVHIYGLPVDMDPVLDIAKRHNLLVIEDAAEMHGQEYKGRKCGSFGDVSIFSFYPNKHITTGEGGMVVADDPEIAERCRSLRNLCFMKERRFVHEELGWNYRMTNLQAALGLAQLEQIDRFIDKKRAMGATYHAAFSSLPDMQLPLVETSYAKNIYWVFAMIPGDSYEGNAIKWMAKLGEEGIGSRPFFYPMHQQPVFLNQGLFKNESYPVAEHIAEAGFYIPSGLGLSEKDMDIVIDKVTKLFSR
ncbi:MAG: DegT/DnrJ/EryC1/StrS family aminotransferase [Flavobacteriales bacterium]|nr:DegT/DnrJ/EryC1/StrS family aminotransferase [Flavobacteriales bacterium]